ncbi:MAG TPA: GNAT family protein [Polyangiaceae bacterium]|nr:GNAT family protein [Polyangiaceae bacterium]
MSDELVSVSLDVRLDAKKVVLRAPRATDIAELRGLLIRNAEHLRPWSPSPPPGTNPAGFTELGRSIARHRRDWKAGSGYVFVVQLRVPREPIVGRIALSSVTRGPFQSAQLGYWMDAGHVRRGLMSEAVDAALGFAFDRLGLHRMQAAVMPTNHVSRTILQKRGFREEGYAERYLRIAGKWEDHVLYGLTLEEWRPSWRAAHEADHRAEAFTATEAPSRAAPTDTGTTAATEGAIWTMHRSC